MPYLTIVIDIENVDPTRVDPEDVAEDIMDCYTPQMRAGLAEYDAKLQSARWDKIDLIAATLNEDVSDTSQRLHEAEAEFDAYYQRGGKGQADETWKRIAERHGVLGAFPTPRVSFHGVHPLDYTVEDAERELCDEHGHHFEHDNDNIRRCIHCNATNGD